ncbi:hypothetical protein J4G08_03665 [Candidatus Poribacteria bacterium]|nr:hypothetical protein [Candidatus Poribacteria bacterium]
MKKFIILIIIMFLVVIVSVSIYTYKFGSSTEKFQWTQHWDELDLTAIKRDYQPYTVAEMHEMWNDKLVVKYGGAERLKQAIGKADEVYPQDTYLARMLELGRPFVGFSDYEDALTEQRISLFSARVYWESMSSTERAAYLDQQGLPPNATWAVYEEMLLKNDVVYSINFWCSKQQDPYMNGTLPSRFDESCKPNSNE